MKFSTPEFRAAVGTGIGKLVGSRCSPIDRWGKLVPDGAVQPEDGLRGSRARVRHDRPARLAEHAGVHVWGRTVGPLPVNKLAPNIP